jgi:hypothetical protein
VAWLILLKPGTGQDPWGTFPQSKTSLCSTAHDTARVIPARFRTIEKPCILLKN